MRCSRGAGRCHAERHSWPRLSRRVGGVPQEAYRYTLGSRSAIEWIMDRYQVKVDKASKIRNDPND